VNDSRPMSSAAKLRSRRSATTKQCALGQIVDRSEHVGAIFNELDRTGRTGRIAARIALRYSATDSWVS